MAKAEIPDKYQSMLDQISQHCGDIAGMRVLDLGSDGPGKMVAALKSQLEVGEAVGVNPAVRKLRSGDGWQVIPADARELPFEDETFDLVISIAAFEHIHGLPAVLEQAHRVLRPGGSLFSSFGPIWSGCWGHHLNFQHDGRWYTFANATLPPYCHLLMERDELRQWLLERFEPAVADKATTFVFDSPDQNRLFFDEYERAFHGSDFTVEHFTGKTNNQRRADYAACELEEAIGAVQRRCVDRHGFEYDSISVVLKKS